jgi:hypothetical protein
MRLICIFLLVFSIHFLKAQNSEIVFSPTYGNAKLSLNTNYFLKSINDSIQFTTIKCYVSHITLYKQQEVVYQSSTPKLLDISQSSSLVIKTSISSFDSISFMIGVDSLTQVSGAYGGDLDPTNGLGKVDTSTQKLKETQRHVRLGTTSFSSIWAVIYFHTTPTES